VFECLHLKKLPKHASTPLCGTTLFGSHDEKLLVDRGTAERRAWKERAAPEGVSGGWKVGKTQRG
ncbi:hypothetical protein ACFOPQ_00595, partial [Deinococcus antarcticus]